MKRYLEKYITDDLTRKMVFIGGPRQVGKTTISQNIAYNSSAPFEYINWDSSEGKKKIVSERFSPEALLLIFDELHKYKGWKNYIKGLYDTKKGIYKFLVTGSARLDLYRRGGDSMLGRYYYYRLHPFSVAELMGAENSFEEFTVNSQITFPRADKDTALIVRSLMKYGCFPEPLLAKSLKELHRWQNERKARVVREDIRDTEDIREFSLFQVFTDLIPERVGSPLSINSMREDIKVAHQTAAKWLDILDAFYYSFRIYPFNFSKARSLKKEPKLYLWDYSELTDEGVRFENLIASHLLKFIHFLYDVHGVKADLTYIRDFSKREIDFLITVNGIPYLCVEAKLSGKKVSKNLHYFAERLHIPHRYQVVLEGGIDFLEKNIRCISADRFLAGLV